MFVPKWMEIKTKVSKKNQQLVSFTWNLNEDL